MYKVAIVEDEWEQAENLHNCLNKYSAEYGVEFNVTRCKNGLEFLEKFTSEFDIVFMDVDMPHMNGFETAKRMREISPSIHTTVLIFVTYLAKYAVRGYEVSALDYVIKPVNYNALRIKIENALSVCDENAKNEIMIPVSGGLLRLELSHIKYIEISGHNIVYHTSRGEYTYYGSMRSLEKLFPQHMFCRCNRSYLVNLRNVSQVDSEHVYIGNKALPIGRSKRKEFIDALHEYYLRGDAK